MEMAWVFTLALGLLVILEGKETVFGIPRLSSPSVSLTLSFHLSCKHGRCPVAEIASFCNGGRGSEVVFRTNSQWQQKLNVMNVRFLDNKRLAGER
jgi:hypothetical protein